MITPSHAKRRSFLLAVCSLTTACVVVPVGCDRPGADGLRRAGTGIRSVPLAARSGADGGLLFERLDAERTGIDFVHKWTPPQHYEHQIDNATSGGGVAIGDYDGDGLADIYLTRPFGGGRLYRNLGGLRFEDVTEQAGVADGTTWSTGPSFVDIDNDGDLDLYVCGYDCPNRLYINRGSGTFTEQAKSFGLDFSGASIMTAFADYDHDGDLDVYLVTNRLTPYESVSAQADQINDRWVMREEHLELVDLIIREDGSPWPIKAGQYDHLYRNNGDATFSKVSDKAGIGGNHYGLSATWWDYNGDGWEDLYVANDFFGPDQLYRNNANGTFTEVIQSALPHTPWFSMGSDTADINNDGRLDFMATDMSSPNNYKQKVSMGEMEETGWFLEHPEPRQYMRNAVYLNTGTNRFMEVAYLLGLADTDWTWSIRFADLDSDGRVDLFVSNGMTRSWFNADLRVQTTELPQEDSIQVWLNTEKRRDQNMAFKNMGDLRFRSVGAEWGLAAEDVSFGAALADLDNDGDLDVVVNNFEDPVGIYENRGTDGHRVKIRLRGESSNHDGIGATIRVHTPKGVQTRYLTLSRGFMAGNEPRVYFGLGPHEKIDRLTVRWPRGLVQQYENLTADRFYTVSEPSTAQMPDAEDPDGAKPDAMFEPSAAVRGIKHQERAFDDFSHQRLLPNRLSRLGPGMAWADVDGDGDEDLYLGGAAGMPGLLCIRKDDGGLKRNFFLAGIPETEREDMAPLFFDADADADMDLFVVSGGVECETGSELLRDRLYLNDGGGKFAPAPAGALPDLRDSGSTVVAADFDRDGDLDLFIGGRAVPGRWPLTPNSRLLRNDGSGETRFTDVTDQAAPGLRQTGLVTSAIWSDADGDGWIDLLVTHEWGPVKLWRNREGRFTDSTGDAGLAGRLGWFNGIAARDIDNDGDIDYVVTNFGLNTKYKATKNKPVLAFYGDFEGTGELCLIEASYEDQTLYPVRGRSCSANAMPFLSNKFETFHAFASATLADVYTERCLSEAHRYEANSLESGCLINDGRGRFTFRPLPRLAQAAPGFGVVLTEVDGDGNADLYIAQNFFGPQRETGRMDGGLSLLLTGSGDGDDPIFTPVWPDRSGMVVPGDAKGLSAVDLNHDGWVDFVVGINDGELIAFENRALAGGGGNRVVTVRLQGRPGNPTGVGARVAVHLDSGSAQTAEVQAGGSYLSQSSPDLVFGLGRSESIAKVVVRWPDGQSTTTAPEADQRIVTIEQPLVDVQP